MSAIPPKSKSADDRNLVTVDENYVAPGLEDQLRLFWAKHSSRVVLVLVAVALVLLGNEGRKYLAARHDREVGEAFAAATTPAALNQFISAYPTEPQAGLAQLRLADAHFAAGDNTAARAAYTQAASNLANAPAGPYLAARARLGAGVAALLAGQTAEAEAALTALATDKNAPAAIRAEAVFTRAIHAASAGFAAEAAKLAEQAEAIDPSGPWKSRAGALAAVHPAPAATVTAPILPAPAPEKTDALPKLAPLPSLPAAP
jgi:tetratricopeptide (TPR) repeat protein